jgi:hypothetical protein
MIQRFQISKFYSRCYRCQYSFRFGEFEILALKSVNLHPSVDSLTKQEEEGWSPDASASVPAGKDISHTVGTR